MATVPGILYIADYHGTGGPLWLDTNVDGLNFGKSEYLLDRRLNRFLPDNETTGVPNASTISCWPYYDLTAGPTYYLVASSTTTSATVSPSPGWTTDEWVGRQMTLLNTAPIPGVGIARRLVVTSNTADTVSFATTTAPTVGQAFRLGLGRFNDYHPSAGKLHLSEVGQVSFRGGSSPMTGGVGLGPDATLLRKLYETIYSESPYYHFWKWGTTNKVYDGWADSPNNAARASFLAEMVRVDNAATERGNTISWEWCIIDLSGLDIVAAAGNPLIALLYKTRLLEMIAWIRSSAVTDNADLKIILVNHRDDLWSTTAPSGTPFFNSVHRELAAEEDNVGIVDMAEIPVGQQVGSSDTPATEAKYYSQAGYLEYGERVATAMLNMSLGIPDAADGGFPVYVLLGDSIGVGPILITWTNACANPKLSGPTTGSLLRPSNQLIWNRGTSELEVYLPHTNSNTSGTVSATAGPELSIMAELGILHPEGFALVKRAANGSGLAAAVAYNSGDGSGGRWAKSADEHYPELQADFAAALQYINEVLGKQADMRGMFVSLGHNDQGQTDGGEDFAAALPQFCRDVWADFTTRTSGANFPITWRRPQDEATGVVDAQMALVRAALQTQKDLETQFDWIDVDDLERDKDDDLHESADSSVEHGFRAVANLMERSL